MVLGSSLTVASAAYVLTTGERLGSSGDSRPFGSDDRGSTASTTAEAAAEATQGSGGGVPGSAGGGGDGQAGSSGGAEPLLPPAAAASLQPPLVAAQQAVLGAPQMPVNGWKLARLRLWDPLTGRSAPGRGGGGVDPAAQISESAMRRPCTPPAPPSRPPPPLPCVRAGHSIPVRDPACTLRTVGVVYDQSNVWANIQPSGHPWDISWDLRQAAGWRPFFGPVIPPRDLATLQVGGGWLIVRAAPQDTTTPPPFPK